MQYKIHDYIRDDENLRNGFFKLIKQVFPGADFKTWYEKGFWTDKYHPFCLSVDGKIVANVSAAEITAIINSKEHASIQIGAVATLPEYRNRGYSRILMDHVLTRYEGDTDFIFLFANETVVDFYPKFGFQKVREVAFKAETNLPVPQFNARKLNLNDDKDLELIKRLVYNRLPVSELFGVRNCGYVTFWHIFNLFPNCLYYLKDKEIIVIASWKEDHLHVWDVIFTEPIEFSAIFPRVIDRIPKSIIYYFSPDIIQFKYDSTFTDDDSPFFVRGNFTLESIDFKFPATAQT